ncbi:glutamine-rich protein 2-like isoform X7 [Ptychodera flava]|uniref:glutamine-rich protein 2-like isoform X7 n=1 Tax=Ptychodera flava TaxID=63121 RepID=UPI00396A6FFD
MTATMRLGEMVDLALGTPEVGAVNFNVLHTFLHAVVEHLNLRDVKAEVDATDKELLTKSQLEKAGQAVTDEDKLKDGRDADDGGSSDPIPLPTRSTYHVLEAKVSRLENQIESLNSLPSNQQLMDRSRSSEKVTPVSDMWQQMQMSKRIDANEEGVAKLMSMVDDVLAEVNKLKDDTAQWKQQLDDLKQQLDKVNAESQSFKDRLNAIETSTPNKDRLDELQRQINQLNAKMDGFASADMFDNYVTWPALEDALKGVQPEPVPVADQMVQTSQQRASPVLSVTPIAVMKEHADLVDEMSASASVMKTSTSQQTVQTTEQYSQTSRQVSPAPSRPGSSRPGSRAGPSEEIQKILAELGELTGKHSSLDERITALEEKMPQKINREEIERLLANQRIPDDLAAQLLQLKQGLDTLTKNKEKDGDLVSNIQTALLQLQADIEKVTNSCSQLVDEANAKQRHIDALYTFIDRLQEIKADKEHVTMEIDVKADKRSLEGKVSRQQFEGTVGEISKNVDDLLTRLGGHQDAFDRAIHQIELDIDNKLDRMELDPLKEYLENRIKTASAKMMKSIAPPVDEHDDAAGFRRPVVQKVHCISCDRPVDLAAHGPVPSLPESKPLPGTRSGRPYTTFELEQIRAHQKSGRPGRNMIHFDRSIAEHELARKRKQDLIAYMVHYKDARPDVFPVNQGFPEYLERLVTPRIAGGAHTINMTNSQRKFPANQCYISQNVPEMSEYYVTSRACGGSHTMTFPHRRINRMTHLNQLFQDEEPTTPLVSVTGRIETEIQGADGHIYKGRMESADTPGKLPALPGQQPPKTTMKSARTPRPTSSGRGSRKVVTPAPSTNAAEQPMDQSSSRPTSGRPLSARPASRQGSRPTSGRPSSARPSGQGSPKTPPQETVPSAVEVPQAVVETESDQATAEQARQPTP